MKRQLSKSLSNFFVFFVFFFSFFSLPSFLLPCMTGTSQGVVPAVPTTELEELARTAHSYAQKAGQLSLKHGIFVSCWAPLAGTPLSLPLSLEVHEKPEGITP